MFCPKCKAEYREGFFKCSGCHIDLVKTLPEATEPLNKLCPKCKMKYPDSFRVCSECYTDLKAGVCPKCKAEYRQGVQRCSDCHIELVSSIPQEKFSALHSREKSEAEDSKDKNIFRKIPRISSLRYSPKETLLWLFANPSMRKRSFLQLKSSPLSICRELTGMLYKFSLVAWAMLAASA